MDNPILSEIANISPAAKQALITAHQNISAQAQPILGTDAPRISPQAGAASVAAVQPAPRATLSFPTPKTFPDLPTQTPQSVTAPRGTTDGDTAEQARLLSHGSGISNIQNPFLRGLARTADVAGQVFAPRLEQAIPGSEGNQRMLLSQVGNQISQDVQNDQRRAMTQHENIETSNIGQPNQSPLLTDAGYVAFNPKTATTTPISDANGNQIQSPEKAAANKPIDEQAYESAIKNGVDPIEAYRRVKDAANVKDSSIQQQYLDALAKGDTATMANIQKTVKATKTDPAIQLIQSREAASEEGKEKSAATKAAKPTADEQRRADLTDNLNENLNQLEGILQRRPELFGPLAGRMTELKNRLGTDDPDIAALETLKHQMGMAQISAHGMRSAQGIESAAESLVNSFHNTPAAMEGAIKAARQSVNTFTHDQNNPSEPRGGGQPKDGETKTNSHGDKVVFKNGAWGPA